MTRVPITSPLAVLTTRTTQEHLMTTHSPTDLKPGDIVQHPMWGNGVVAYTKFGLRVIGTSDGYECIFGLTGWERVETETARPGHVQVRVDDLADELRRYAALGQGPACLESNVMLRVTRALDAQCAESTLPAGEKPTNATVTLPCPDCGEPITNTAMVEVNREGERYLDFCNVNVHTCPPAQPDEPTEFGARIVVTLPDGTREKWLRSKVNTNEAWRAGNGSEIGWFSATTWDNVIERGTVTLGWDE